MDEASLRQNRTNTVSKLKASKIQDFPPENIYIGGFKFSLAGNGSLHLNLRLTVNFKK